MNRKALLGISAAALLSLGLVACGGGSSASDVIAYPGNGDAAAGKTAFLGSAGCSACHTVAGTTAAGKIGPELTKVGSMLTPDQIFTQISDPKQRPAPYIQATGGAQMTANNLTSQQRADITAYLSSLK